MQRRTYNDDTSLRLSFFRHHSTLELGFEPFSALFDFEHGFLLGLGDDLFDFRGHKVWRNGGQMSKECCTLFGRSCTAFNVCSGQNLLRWTMSSNGD